MDLILIINILILAVVSIIGIHIVLKADNARIDVNEIIKNQQEGFERLMVTLEKDSKEFLVHLEKYFESQNKLIKTYNDMVSKEVQAIANMQRERLESVDKLIEKMTKTNETGMDKMSSVVEKRLDQILKNNDKKLDDMRKTVDEKLNEGLEKRFNESFKFMNNQFDQVSIKLGEMKKIASSVDDFKKVLSNVKTRGVFGEIQLENLLDQILSSQQYEKNVQVKENSQERVDFAILLPGNTESSEVYLPIDSKFPIEDYLALSDAVDEGKEAEVTRLRKNIDRNVKKEAGKISKKYINPPNTTSFAIMYIPIEGLFSEILKNNQLMSVLQNQYKVIVSGPTTFAAMLNSLQLGFKTLTMQKYSKEIWDALEGFKAEFGNFTSLLSRTQKKVGEVSNTLDDATKRTKIIQRKLDSVSSIASIEKQKQIESDNSEE